MRHSLAALLLVAACAVPPTQKGAQKTMLIGVTWLRPFDEHVLPLLKRHAIDVFEDPGACDLDGVRVLPQDALRADSLLREDAATKGYYYQSAVDYGRQLASNSARQHLLGTGAQWMNDGDAAYARGWFDASCRLFPDDPEGFERRAVAELRLGLLAEARESYRVAKETAARNPYGYQPWIKQLEN